MRAPPLAPERPRTATLHGVARGDPYAWLKDANWRTVMREPAALDAAIRAHLEAENAYTEAALAPTARCAGRSTRRCGRASRRTTRRSPPGTGPGPIPSAMSRAANNPLFCRAEAGAERDWRVLLDGNREAGGSAYFKLGHCRHSPDHRPDRLQPRPQRFGALPDPCARYRRRRGDRRLDRGRERRSGLGERRQNRLLHRHRRQPPPAPGPPPRRRHRRGRRRGGLRRAGSGVLRSAWRSPGAAGSW